jgi:hypothetical protein
MEEVKKYIDNPLFIKWVYEPDDNIREYWEFYINKYPHEKPKLKKLKEELELFDIHNQKLTENRKLYLLKKIEKKIRDKHKADKIKNLSRYLLKYAAIALLFITIGGTFVYLYLEKKDINNFSGFIEIPQISDKPFIVLSDGSTINLDSNESEVEYTSNNQMVVNKDSIVDLSLIEEANNSPIFQSIPYGYRSKVILSDKSVVWLNAGSRLIYPPTFTGNEREVILFGEAFFEIEKDIKKPFVVRTADYSVKVLGTKFNISSYPGDEISQTVLTEGSIKLTINKSGWFNKDIVLEPNQMFSFNKKLKESEVYAVDPEKFVSWKEGIIKCENEDLSRVIKRLERFYNIQIKLVNPLDGTIKIDGKLNLKEDKYEVLYYVSKVAKREFIKKSEQFYIIE